MTKAISKYVTDFNEIPANLRPIYDFDPGAGAYALSPGGQHLQVLRDAQIRERADMNIGANVPLPHSIYERAFNAKMPVVTLRDWTTTIGVAAPVERATLIRLLSAGKIRVKRP